MDEDEIRAFEFALMLSKLDSTERGYRYTRRYLEEKIDKHQVQSRTYRPLQEQDPLKLRNAS